VAVRRRDIEELLGRGLGTLDLDTFHAVQDGTRNGERGGYRSCGARLVVEMA
jgi:hypothetical protein